MTTTIIAIESGLLNCPTCGNDEPEQFTTITEPYVHDGHVLGYTLKGVTCTVCDTAFEFQRVANSTSR
ncbi:hypothetical protein I6F35_38140 [Bradyrhizobium sp. BRP22]|uniref:hypothetical protein n=1 Tax=Bradyrhizobium sp. BRP22 TaxID=2793821 RepID=UPI001CD25231|nr:hypothetical protein [Bradyrhizobium sp. BRP22]MCA1458885.1 hypothetical protein [Bradyrhizobium sp. BRP22]